VTRLTGPAGDPHARRVDDAPTPVTLTRQELVVLAAAVREMMRADGKISEGEADIAADLARRLELAEPEWEAIWQEASRTLPNVKATMEAAARELSRPGTRELVYELLYELATDGSIVDSEWDLLEWLDEAWRFEDSQKS